MCVYTQHRHAYSGGGIGKCEATSAFQAADGSAIRVWGSKADAVVKSSCEAARCARWTCAGLSATGLAGR